MKIGYKKTIIHNYKCNLESDLHVAVLFGGVSEEKEISVLSSKSVIKGLIEIGYKVTCYDVGYDIAEKLVSDKVDVVFNSMHGTYGEDGCIQGLLEIIGIPYTHSGVLASSIAMDKLHSQSIFINNGILCPKRVIINKNSFFESNPIKKPFIIKPPNQGSSVGIELFLENEKKDARDYKFEYSNEAIVEEFIVGIELQVAVLNNKAIGAIQIKPLKSKFYDYETKYTAGMADHIYPAPVSKSTLDKAYKIAENVHKLLGCRGATRSEFIYDDEKDLLYFLEINTHPGFTELSIVPEIAAYNGINFNQLLEMLVNEALER